MCKEYINLQTGEKLDLNILDENSSLKVRPEIWLHLDLEKNREYDIDIYSVSYGSTRIKLHLICDKCNSKYSKNPSDIISKNAWCPYCKGKLVNHTNSLRTTNPELIVIFDTNKNTEYNLDNLSKGSKKKLWWRCRNCNRSYDRSPLDEIKSVGKCPYCMGKRVDLYNSLGYNYPELMKEWNHSKNDNVNPYDTHKGSYKPVWWKCNLNHEWRVSIEKRTTGSNCPYCSNNKVWVGFNDMWTTDSKLAKLLLNPDDGYICTRSTSKKVNWKCSDCNYIIRDRSVNNVSRQGLSCPNCNDNVPFGEKILYQLLSNLNINFQYDNNAEFSKIYRYDFILPDYKLLLETHGLQHYLDTGFSKLNGKSLADEIDNDLTKEKLAIDNGYKYISINTSKNDLILLKNEILNSELTSILNITEESFVGISLNHSLVLECWKLYYEDKLTKIEISKKLKIGRNRVAKYIKLKNQVNEINN